MTMAIRCCSTEESAAIRRAALRLLPVLALLYFVSFLDRVNVGFGALTMNADVGLNGRQFGFGAGIFFIGYVAFAVPANLMLKRVGASRWLSGIAIVWGAVALLMAFVKTPADFYLQRLLLGATESGFLPGVMLYLTEWFPARVIARVIAGFFVAVPLSNVLGAPLSSWLLNHGFWAMHGWQSMFLLEALPAIVLGVAAAFWLDDEPSAASWLQPEERSALVAALASDTGTTSATGLRSGLVSPRVWGLGCIYFLIVMALYGFGFWAPQILRGIGELSLLQTGWATAIPYCGAAASMVAWSASSDRREERTWHVVIASLAGALGFLIAGHATSIWIAVAAFMLSTAGVYSACAVFWTLPRYILGGTGAAAGIGLINSIGNLAGYVGPVTMGWLKGPANGYTTGINVMAASMAAAGVLALALGSRARAPGGERRSGMACPP
jgi:MFS transporter, ACS family, tartrate transporter